MRLKLYLMTVLLLVFLISPIEGQFIPQEYSPDEIARSMEENLTWNLNNEFSKYYDDFSLIVRANISIYQARVKPKSRELPELPNSLLSKKLPGLPELPQKNQVAPENNTTATLSRTIESFFQSSGYRIRKIVVNILADSALNQNDLQFVRRLAMIKGGIKPSRGDQVRVDVIKFPDKANIAISKDAQKQVLQPNNVKTGSFWEKHQAKLLLFLLALIVIGILYFMAKKLLNNTNNVSKAASSPNELSVNDNNAKSSMISNNDINSVLGQKKSSIIDLLVGTPAASANVLNNWISFSEETGIERSAILFKTISPQLLNIVEQYLSSEYINKIKLQIDQLSDEIKPGAIKAVYEQFSRDFKIINLKNTSSDNDKDLFSFLHQLTDQQLLHLVKSVDPGIASIIIAQLNPEVGAKILKKLEDAQRKKILGSICKIEKIPANVFEQIAHKIAGKAQKLSQVKYITSDSVESMVTLIEQFDEKDQQEIFDYLKCTDLKFSERVKSRFLQFSDVLTFPGDKLRDAFRNVDREVLATSLVDINDKHIERIIATLPDKMAEMVRSSLEMKKETEPEDIEKARRTIVKQLRNLK